MRQERRLVAILAADVAGYSRLMALDEAGTLAHLNKLRVELIDPKIVQFKGRVVGSAGDSLLVEFASAVDAVQCAMETQEQLTSRNLDLPEARRMMFRMAINLGDVIAEGGTIYGDAVNVAARLEGLAEPGTLLVGRGIFDQVKGKLPYVFEDLGEHAVKNIPEPVRAFLVSTDRQNVESPPLVSDLPLPAKPSVAVLPLTNMSGDPQQDYFSNGITEDIITELSRNRNLFVIARNSSFPFRGAGLDIADIGRKLGVRYVVQGSVRKAGKRIRITAQLIEASTGTHLWAERYDRDLDDLFQVQDELVDQLVWALAGQVGMAEIDRSRHSRKAQLDAYDMLLRGIEAFNRFTQQDMGHAIELFKAAVKLDPKSPRAYAWLAEAYSHASGFEGEAPKRQLSLEAALRAIDLGDLSGQAEATIAGHCRWRKDYEHAEAHLSRAVALGPRNPYVLSWLGFFRLWQGQLEEARDIGERLRRLDPLDPSWNHWLLGCAYYLLGQYATSLEAFQRWRNNQHYRGLANLAACLGQLGRVEEAQAAWRQCLAVKSDFTLQAYAEGAPYQRQRDLDHWLDGLRKAQIH